MSTIRCSQERLSSRNLTRLQLAAATIEEVVQAFAPATRWTIRAPRSGDFGWVVHRHGALFADEFAWDDRFEAKVAGDVAGFIERRDAGEHAWIAEFDGESVASLFCHRVDDQIAEFKLLFVEPRARRLGIARDLLRTAVEFIDSAGYAQVVAWTADTFVAAEGLLAEAGFVVTGEEFGGTFDRRVTARCWQLELPAR